MPGSRYTFGMLRSHLAFLICAAGVRRDGPYHRSITGHAGGFRGGHFAGREICLPTRYSRRAGTRTISFRRSGSRSRIRGRVTVLTSGNKVVNGTGSGRPIPSGSRLSPDRDGKSRYTDFGPSGRRGGRVDGRGERYRCDAMVAPTEAGSAFSPLVRMRRRRKSVKTSTASITWSRASMR